MGTQNYKVWTCKIVVPADAELPPAFDAPPRRAAITAVQEAGIKVIACNSGWGGSLTKEEAESMTLAGDVYFAGLK